MRHASIPQHHQLAEAVPARYRALSLVAGFGGLRWAELVGLRRRHVDLAGARVYVLEQAAEVAGKIIVSPPKTDAGRRVVTLPRVAVDALAEHLEQYAGPGPDGLVFTTPRGADLLRSPFNRFVWRPAVAQVGLDGLRVHVFRHTGGHARCCRRRHHEGADGAHGAHLAGGGAPLPACDGRPAGRARLGPG